MALTLGAAINRALRTIGEPDIAAFTTTNQLQNTLIDDANETVHDILEAARHRWGLHHDELVTRATVTTEKVAVTNGSTTVTSVTDAGADADNFTGVAAGDYIRVGTDDSSYKIASVDTASSPDTVTLETAYQGTTSTAASYTIIRDTYSISTDVDMDEPIIVTYGDSPNVGGSDQISIVDMQTLHSLANGDLHRNTSGKPTHMAEISPDSADAPRWVLWPYPDTAYLLTFWHTIKFTSNTTFATNLFGGDAPDIAYDAVAHHLRWRACMWDEDMQQANTWMDLYEKARYQVVARENRQHRSGENAMSIKTYRATNPRGVRGIQGVSQITFDRA